MLSFKVSASVLVFVGSFGSSETNFNQEKERGIHHWSDSEQISFFEEFIEEEEEEEEEEDSEFSKCYEFSAFSLTQNGFSSSRLFKCRRVERKLFMLYQSYKIDCVKF